MEKWANNKAWFLVLPVVIIVAFSAIIPLMTVINYSVQDIWGPGQSVFVGTEWFEEMLGNKRLHDALWRQFLFSGLVLLIEMPLGILIALAMPKRGWGVSACLVTIAIPLLIPWNVIGTIWIIFTRPDIGLFGAGINNLLGIAFDHTDNWLDAWITNPRGLLPGSQNRWRVSLGEVSIHPTAENARRTHHRIVAALHG
jgi:glycerol transport system permease protein